LGRAGSC